MSKNESARQLFYLAWGWSTLPEGTPPSKAVDDTSHEKPLTRKLSRPTTFSLLGASLFFRRSTAVVWSDLLASQIHGVLPRPLKVATNYDSTWFAEPLLVGAEAHQTTSSTTQAHWTLSQKAAERAAEVRETALHRCSENLHRRIAVDTVIGPTSTC